MSQTKFLEYATLVYGSKSGTAKSYNTAIKILDELFAQQDVFGLHGTSLFELTDLDLVHRIVQFVREQEELYRNNHQSIFKYIRSNQTSYPRKRFCTGAIAFLEKFVIYRLQSEKSDRILASETDAASISCQLLSLFKVDKEGKTMDSIVKVRIGQNYFRKIVLVNYSNQCAVTGIDIPEVLRASHISAWADDKKNRMNPCNGLCLSATYDAAFDSHLISFDEDLRMVLSPRLRDYYTSDAVKKHFHAYEGKKLSLPERFMPDQDLLEKHRNLLVS